MTPLAAVFAACAALSPLAAAASSDETYVRLAFAHPHPPQIVIADERALADDVNAARAARGLPPLVVDEELSRFALQVAERMARLHYFGHTDPDGVTFRDRLRASGIRYQFAAENLAYDQDEHDANVALLHSPGHYANIVDPHPHRLGVAVVAAGDGELFFVEEFAD